MASVDRRIQGDVKLRKNNIRRIKDGYEKSLSMSILETKFDSNNEQLIYCDIDYTDRDTSNLPASRNKWNASTTSLVEEDQNNNNIGLARRKSSTFSSANLFQSSTNELIDINENAKPILKLWATKNKYNIEKRNSVYNSTEKLNISKEIRKNSLTHTLKDTPWGRHFKQTKASENFAPIPDRHCKIQNGETPQTQVTKSFSDENKITSKQNDNFAHDEKRVEILKEENRKTKKYESLNNFEISDTRELIGKESTSVNIEIKDTGKILSKLRKNSRQENRRKENTVSQEYQHSNFLINPKRLEEDNNPKSHSNVDSNHNNLSDSRFKPPLETKINSGLNFSNRSLSDITNILSKSPLDVKSKKEIIERTKSVSLINIYDIDFESVNRQQSEQDLYTNIESQISDCGNNRKTSAPESFRKTFFSGTNKTNISRPRKKSEPILNYQQTQAERLNENTLIKTELDDNDFETKLIDNTEMNDTHYSNHLMRKSLSPGSNCGSDLSTSSILNQTSKSTIHSRNGFRSINLRNDNNPNKTIFENRKIRYRSASSSDPANDSKFITESNLKYNRPNRSNSDIIAGISTYEPKSTYLRKRLQELSENDKNILKSNLNDCAQTEIKGSESTCITTTKTTTDKTFTSVHYSESTPSYTRQTSSSSATEYKSYGRKYSDSSTLSSDLGLGIEERVRNLSRSSSLSSNNSDIFEGRQRSSSRDSDNMDFIFKRRTSLRSSGSSSSGKFLRNDNLRLSDRSSNSTLKKNKKSETTRKLSVPEKDHEKICQMNDLDKQKSVSVFGSVTKVHSSKISGVEELRSYSARRRTRLRNSETDSQQVGATVDTSKSNIESSDNSRRTSSGSAVQSPITPNERCVSPDPENPTEKSKSHSRFSFRRKSSHTFEASSDNTKTDKRKHSITQYFGFRKQGDKSKSDSPRSESPIANVDTGRKERTASIDGLKRSDDIVSATSPTLPSRDRRGSGIFRFFQKRSSISSPDDLSNVKTFDEQESIREDDESTVPSPKKVVARMISISSVKSKKTSDTDKSQSSNVKKSTVKIGSLNRSYSTDQPNQKTSDMETKTRTNSEPVKISHGVAEANKIEKPNSNETEGSVSITINKQKNSNNSTNGYLPNDMKDVEADSNEILEVNEGEKRDQFSTPDTTSRSNDLQTIPVPTEKKNQQKDRRKQNPNVSEIKEAIEIKPVDETERSLASNESEKVIVNVVSSPASGNLVLPGMRESFGGSTESLHSDSETSTRRTSKNKERIRQRKAARLEARERKSLPAGLGDIQIDFNSTNSPGEVKQGENKTNSNNNESPKEPEKVTPRTRKKHKARRANTEFINIPKLQVQPPSPALSRDDGIVLRRNNRRNRRDRPKTLTAGVDADLIFNQGGQDNDSDEKSEVVNETLSFADIKKKLLEGLTDDKKIPDKVPSKARQKIKRTKSSKRYKTITEGIAPRDLALAKQAMEAENNDSNGQTIDKETLAQITAALTSTSDKRKSFIVDSRPPSRYASKENLKLSDPDLSKHSNEAEDIKKSPAHTLLKRTKSMTTIHLQLDDNNDQDEPEIKPLSELKNRFLQAMEETKQKHLQKKTPIEIKRKNKRRDRAARPHTICGLDDWTMEQIKNETEAPENELKKKNEIEKSEMEKVKENLLKQKISDENKENRPASKKREKKKYNRTESQKMFDELFDDVEDLLNEGISEADLAETIGCNPSLHQDIAPVDLKITGNEVKVTSLEIEEKEVPTEPLSDLDFVSSQTSQLSSSIASNKRSLRPQRKQRSAANPLKALQQRDDLIKEEDIKNASKEEKKSQHPVVEAFRGLKQTADQKNPAKQLLNRSDLADEAVSALRATVDFTQTSRKLRKVEVGQKVDDALVQEFVVSNITNLLLQIKGRKKVQTTVVEFKPESLNSNDCFVVVTPKDLFCWNGANANVIERAKAAEIASRINQKKELGCKAFEVIHVDEGSAAEGKMLRTLGATICEKNSKGPTTDDEDFEKAITSAYMTYTVCETSDPPVLIPLDSECHRMPTKEILETHSAFVFDFINEVYVWLGRQTSSHQRKVVQKLAAAKFEEGYFKLNLGHDPSYESIKGTSRRISLVPDGVHASGRRGSKQRRISVQQGRHQYRERLPRPDYSLLLLLYEGSEWVIFREKFCDWPDESRVIRMKGGPVGELAKTVSTDISIQPVDPSTMIDQPKQTTLKLEGVDLGRGRGIPKGMDGYHVITIDVKTWHVNENNSILLPDESFGQFHSGEGYVIRWHYRVVKVRALRNVDDIMKAGGMERCCYFFWLGNDCSINEEGATAVMTIELDKEKGPQIRCVLGKEPPALLNIFDGSMVIHAGKRPVPGVRKHFTDQSIIRLYCVRNELESEACLLQVPPVCESLRSRSSFVLLLCAQGEVFLWHGCKSNEGSRKAAEHAAKQLIELHPEEAAIANKTEIGLTEVEEGEEPEVFWIALGGKEDYGSLLNVTADVSNLMPRLFQLDATTDTFVSHEVVCPSRIDKFNCPFPVLQDDLYNVEQPAIFLLDSTTHCYLWFGWWPDEEESEASMSRRRRWGEERRKAMESVVKYAEVVGRPLQNLFAIYAGLEPESFIELFPYWVVQEDITDMQIDEGIEEDKLFLITEELAMFSKEFYTIDELLAKPPPQGVDPTKLEKYLSEEDFLEVFKFHKETFYKLPGWQQVNWKKKVGLY